MLSKLIESCQRTTFDVGGQNVLDENYRKAKKLDCKAFLTNLHPYNFGIIDSIRRIMILTNYEKDEGIGIGRRGIKTELYKLNVGIQVIHFF